MLLLHSWRGMSGSQVASTAGNDAEAKPIEQFHVGISLLSQDSGQFTGTGTYVRGILNEFAAGRLGLEVEVLCNEHALGVLTDSHDSHLTLRPARGFRLGGSRISRIAAIAGASIWSPRLTDQFSDQARVIHYPLTIAVPKTRLPTVVTLHDVQHHELRHYFSLPQRAWRHRFHDGAARRATVVITDSEHARERIIDILGVPSERVVAIHLAVDHQRFRPLRGGDDEQLLRELALPSRFLLYPASLWPHKNHRALLDALARIEDNELELILTGLTFGRLDEIMTHAAKRGLDGRVRHLGLVSDAALPALYRAATMLVFPSLYEGFGVPPLEAMACGCPVASSLVASLAEVCGDAAAALDPADSEQMAATIQRVLEDSGLRARMRDAGLAQASRFSWAAASEAHLAVYRRAAELGPNSTGSVRQARRS